jgi:hypothetical protein
LKTERMPSSCRMGCRSYAHLALCVLASFVAWGCQEGSKPKSFEFQKPAITGVRTMTIVPVTADDLYETSGTG